MDKHISDIVCQGRVDKDDSKEDMGACWLAD